MTDIENLFNLVENMKLQKGELCLICQFPITDKKDNCILDCKHHFHSSCIQFKSKVSIICPYCNKVTFNKNIKNNFNICKVILKSGKRKGEICNRKNCGYHKKS